MPLIILCGIPASGKTVIAQQLEAYLKDTYETIVINEESLGIDKQLTYAERKSEMNLRALLRSNVQAQLTSSRLVILDSMNYIKGFRYELHCLVRSARTTQCTVWCNTDIEIAQNWNQTYTQDLFTDLANRLEAPNDRNRWDRPLFIVSNGQIDLEGIKLAIETGATPREPISTKRETVVQTDFIYQLESKTNKIIDFISDSQNTYGEGITVKYNQLDYTIERIVPPLELRRIRQQYIKIIKSQPIESCSIESNFLEYVVNNI